MSLELYYNYVIYYFFNILLVYYYHNNLSVAINRLNVAIYVYCSQYKN